MTPHPLDRPAWHALKTRQAAFAVGDDRAVRFLPDVAPFAATRDDGAESLASLAKLVPADGYIVLLQLDEIPCPPGVSMGKVATGVQMVLDNLRPPRGEAPVERLDEADAPHMQALATLTKPGPFLQRTHRLGVFWGVKEGGRLLAMAGERMKLDGFTEVSGVCTHPDARGRGYASALTRAVAAQILRRGETPFLHAYADNRAAIGVYESLGFRLRRNVRVAVLKRA